MPATVTAHGKWRGNLHAYKRSLGVQGFEKGSDLYNDKLKIWLGNNKELIFIYCISGYF